MATPRAKRNAKTTSAGELDETSPADLAVIDLDPPTPPDPAIARWEALTGDADINHGGDASKVLPFPRPAWSNPDEDLIGNGASGATAYASAPARVIATLEAGVNHDDEYLEPASVGVRVLAWMPGDSPQHCIRITLSRASGKNPEKPWINSRMLLTLGQAMELANLLTAGVEMAGGSK